LLFFHGREAYRRNSFLVVYMFYKNVTFVMPQYWFGFVSAFSGQTLYESWIYQLYNIVFTAFPIMWYAVMDKEFSKIVFQQQPEKY
jgi:phospholipid-transporting ATPase